ncbi:unnamed protein product [Microthlaspi erraticum]|uniref:Uncharacterized protein n=1 Tax=Microthlaspi erraticum TaxID=1685480 RepID=A0A6D2L4Q9_9BRAS|nr:unnamed protein product [Microthlaspi erraticum]
MGVGWVVQRDGMGWAAIEGMVVHGRRCPSPGSAAGPSPGKFSGQFSGDPIFFFSEGIVRGSIVFALVRLWLRFLVFVGSMLAHPTTYLLSASVSFTGIYFLDGRIRGRCCVPNRRELLSLASSVVRGFCLAGMSRTHKPALVILAPWHRTMP